MAAAAVPLYLGLPRLAGLDDTWRRVSSGDPLGLCAAVLLEVAVLRRPCGHLPQDADQRAPA
jgi:hypothetical protein